MIDYLLHTTLNPFFKKRFFGKDYILFSDYFNNSYILSEYSLTLGYMYKNNFSDFVELFTDNTDKTAVIEAFKEFGETKKNAITSEITSTLDFFLETEIKIIIDNLYEGLDYKNVLELYKIRNKKIPITLVKTLTNFLVYNSIGFGFKYPELCEKLFNHKIDDENYNLAYDLGVNIPKESTNISISERLIFAKTLITPYVKKNRPNLLDKLQLT